MLINELKDKTILIITHDAEILPQMDRVIDLKTINNNL